MKKIDQYFKEISMIPRGSYNEKAICDYVEEFASKRNLKYIRDEMHNIIIYKDATSGYEDHETIMLEAHMDMVCEKNNDSNHDFINDPIELIEKDGFLYANKTTLGADDGVGVCYMLAILDDNSLKHPALECVFTVQEEVGLNGAMNLKKDYFKAKKMIGLDSGDEKVVTVSCSGGRRVSINKELNYESNDLKAYSLTVGGLQGGHSGGMIHLEKGNANVIMTRLYYQFIINGIDFKLGSLKGGLKDNAIARECVSSFASNSDFAKIEEIVLKVENELKEELKESDENVYLEINTTSLDKVLSNDDSKDIITMMYLMPNGFQHKSLKMDLTNVSLNMGVVEMNDKLHICYSLRSPMLSAKTEMSNKLSLIASLFNAEYVLENDYPGWNYEENSMLRKVYIDYVKETEGVVLTEEGTHGGLETGIIKGLIEDLDIITLGPDMFDIHSPSERLDIASYHRCYDRLVGLLARL